MAKNFDIHSDFTAPVFKPLEEIEQWVEIESILPTKIYEDIMAELQCIFNSRKTNRAEKHCCADEATEYENMIEKSYSDFFWEEGWSRWADPNF